MNKSRPVSINYKPQLLFFGLRTHICVSTNYKNYETLFKIRSTNAASA